MRYKTEEMNEIDKEVTDAFDRGVPVWIIASTLKTSRGAIYRRIERNKNPDKYQMKESEYYKKNKHKLKNLKECKP